MQSLGDYFNKKHHELVSQFETSSLQKSSDNLGFNRERFVNLFLRKVLPKRLSVVQGEIFGKNESGEIVRSGQLDTIVARDDCPVLDFGGRNSYLFGGVFAVIEVKSSLTCSFNSESGEPQGTLASALATFKKISTLCKSTTQCVIGADLSNIPAPLRIIVAYDGLDVDTINKQKYRKLWHENVEMICVLNKGVVVGKKLGVKFTSDLGFNGDNEIKSKGASLGLLYYFILQYGTTFVFGDCDLRTYFQDIDKWE